MLDAAAGAGELAAGDLAAAGELERAIVELDAQLVSELCGPGNQLGVVLEHAALALTDDGHGVRVELGDVLGRGPRAQGEMHRGGRYAGSAAVGGMQRQADIGQGC